jgi:uncharacterized protein YaaN involved in tellurite resistance
MTETQSASPGLKINFDALVGTKPQALPPAQQAMGELMVAKQGVIEPVDITRTLLSENDRRGARSAAEQLYADLLKDRAFRGQWGNEVLTPLNSLVSTILKQRENVDYSSVKPYIDEMNAAVEDFKRNHQSGDSQLQQRLQRLWNAASNLVGELRVFAKKLYVDSLNAEQKLDRVAGHLVKRKDLLEQNVLQCGLIIEKNEEATTGLIGVIAVMEQVILVAQENGLRLQAEMQALPTGSVERRNKERELEATMLLKKDYEQRISAFVQRLSIAWTTTPQVERMQTLSYQLAQRIGLLIDLTIPVLKLVVVQIGYLADAEKAADIITDVDAATNAAIDQLGAEMVRVTDKVARAVEAPSLRADTILRMMDAVVRVNNNLVEVEALGRQQRAEVAAAVQTGYLAIIGSEEKLQAARLAAFKATQAPLELPAAPDMPEEVTQYAQQQGLAISA